MNDTADANQGLAKRRQLLGNGKSIDLIGSIHSDIFCLNKLLLSGIEVRVRLTRSRDAAFPLMNPSGLVACETFCLDDLETLRTATDSLENEVISPDEARFHESDSVTITTALMRSYNKAIFICHLCDKTVLTEDQQSG
ncbi:hypothetical protein QAD02_003007, partial [Eretmocerus hayati]